MKKSTQVKIFSGTFLLLLAFSMTMFYGCESPADKNDKITKVEPSPVEEVTPSPLKPKPNDGKGAMQPNAPTKVVTTTSSGHDKLKPKEKTLADYIKEFSGKTKIDKAATTKEAAKLMEGRVSYSLPDTIKVKETFTATVMISDTAFLESKMIEEVMSMSIAAGETINKEDIKLAQIKIAEIMRAELIDPSGEDNFTIQPSGFQEQHLLDENEMHIVFQWSVTANKPGHFPLKLDINAVFFKGEKEIVQNIPVFSKKVYVDNIPDYSWMKYALGGGLGALILTLLFFKFRPAQTTSKIEAIIEKIGEGETAEAIKMLKAKELSTTNENLLVNHLAEFNDIRRQFNGGMIERSEMQMVVNRIHNSLLEICDEIK